MGGVKIEDGDHAVKRVSAEERKGFFSVSMVAAGFCICMSGLYTGASIANGASLTTAILAGIVGNMILAIYGGLLGYAGAKEGVASALLARHSFGREGSKIIGVLLAVVMLGWFSVQVGFFGDTISAMFPQGGFISSKVAATCWGGLLMLLTAYFGYKGLNALSYVAVPLIFITSVVGIVAALNSVGGWSAVTAKETTTSVSLGTSIVLVVGSFAGGAAAQADITRYAKTPSIALWGTAFGYLVANLFIIMAGFITTKATGIGDLPFAMLSLGLGVPALLVLVLAQWTTNDNNLYTASLGLANIINVPKKKITLITGIFAILVGMAGLSNYFVNWLSLLGIGIPPVAGIIIADYYIVKKQRYDYGPGTQYAAWNIWAFMSWLGGCAVGYGTQWGVPSINSIVIAFVLYLALMKIFGKTDKGFGIVGTSVEQ